MELFWFICYENHLTHKYIFFSKHRLHRFSPEDYLAINSSFVFQDVLGKDFVGLAVIC